ncbi:flagellar export protein FliJ [Litchfieldia alkalitelluris]|uniref:flagellar export protein FliJ n=1 Tax=Litchfieldia alkalitelluris TaxID=304268 RepID=UPI00099609B8|nr:flagellar export protein FliJ [Litchfieldia alkalitelluris]
MAGHSHFHKLIKIKNSEKEEVLANYRSSLSEFENVAEQLYSFMKKKEDLMAVQQGKLSTGMSIYEMRHQQTFISNLEQTIMYYQQLVIRARNKMQFAQDKLIEKNIEVKKYETLQEKIYQETLETTKLIENKYMDEISVQQYINQGFRVMK